MKEKVLEPEIKSILINHLIMKGLFDCNDSIINEFLVGDYSRRVDLALINKNQLIAFEIKSSADTLYRLSGQVEKYLEYFDKVIIVTTNKHTNSALDMTPSNVAIWEINGSIIKAKRRGRKKTIKDNEKLIELMTAKDLVKALKNQNVVFDKKVRRSELISLLKELPLYKIREEAISSIRNRYESTSNAFWEKINNPFSGPSDLLALRTNPVDRKKVSYNNIDNFIDAIDSIELNEVERKAAKQ